QVSGGFAEQPGSGLTTQAPARQASIVQASPSLQSALVAHAPQVGSTMTAHVPALQLSVVQGSASSQSASTTQLLVHVGDTAHTPATQLSVVQVSPSSAQSASTAHAVHPGFEVEAPATQASVVQAFASSQSPSLVQGAQPPAAKFTPRIASSLTEGALVANAVATFVKPLSLQSGDASAVRVTVTVLPIGRSGTRTSSGFVPITVHVTLASSA